jgi:hypothetical protein
MHRYPQQFAKRGEALPMNPTVVSPLANWENFYVIIGSSAGALTGLQFVVIALIADSRRPGSMLEVRAFGSPTVVHFCAALVISAILSAPWAGLSAISWALAIGGLAGVAYVVRVITHARKQTGYEPDAEDWFWYLALPLIAYGALTVAGLLLPSHTSGSLFSTAGIALGLLLIGIHNSWDTVTYIAVELPKRTAQD